jgi:hypothetical protein
MDYQRWWRDRRGLAVFGRRLCDAWTSAYLAASGADLADPVLADPGNGSRYLSGLAGSLSGGTPDGHAPRVVGVWGLSRPGGSGRAHSRIRGHPRPGRHADDRRLGWHVLWHFTGPGRHGVDLVFLTPASEANVTCYGTR